MRPMSAAAKKNRVIVDARDGVGWTAVHHAAARGHLHCVAALVNGEKPPLILKEVLCDVYFPTQRVLMLRPRRGLKAGAQ
jgi:hypothetical protein